MRGASSVRGIERFFYGADDATLHGHGAARDARASRRGMAATAEERGNIVYIDLLAFRTKTDARHFRLDFFEDTSHDDGGDGPDVIDEPFGITAFGAGAGKVGLLEPEVSDLILMGEVEMAVNMPQQARARERIGLIHLITNPRKVRAAPHQLSGDMIGARTCARVLKGAGVSRDGGEKTIGDGLGDRPSGSVQQAKN